jgi:hypothetical protein
VRCYVDLSKLPTARDVATEEMGRPSSGFLCRKPFVVNHRSAYLYTADELMKSQIQSACI